MDAKFSSEARQNLRDPRFYDGLEMGTFLSFGDFCSGYLSGRAINSPTILKWFVAQDIYPPDLPYLTGGVRGRRSYSLAARRVVGSGPSCITALLFLLIKFLCYDS